MEVAVSDDETLLITMTNGDGAAGYGVVWTIHHGRVKSVVYYRDF